MPKVIIPHVRERITARPVTAVPVVEVMPRSRHTLSAGGCVTSRRLLLLLRRRRVALGTKAGKAHVVEPPRLRSLRRRGRPTRETTAECAYARVIEAGPKQVCRSVVRFDMGGKLVAVDTMPGNHVQVVLLPAISVLILSVGVGKVEEEKISQPRDFLTGLKKSKAATGINQSTR